MSFHFFPGVVIPLNEVAVFLPPLIPFDGNVDGVKTQGPSLLPWQVTVYRVVMSSMPNKGPLVSLKKLINYYLIALNRYWIDLAGFHVVCSAFVPLTKSHTQRSPPRQTLTAWGGESTTSGHTCRRTYKLKHVKYSDQPLAYTCISTAQHIHAV